MSKVEFWSKDIQVLFNKDNLAHFFPDASYSITKNLNSIVRLTIYVAIILALLKNNLKYFIIPIITMLITYFIYNFHPNKDELFDDTGKLNTQKHVYTQEKKNVECQQPTTNNPFMNYNQITDTPNKRTPSSRNLFKYAVILDIQLFIINYPIKKSLIFHVKIRDFILFISNLEGVPILTLFI